MNCNENGVAFSGPEIRALLAFGSREESDRDKYGVQVVIEGDRCFARATTGQVSLELEGISDTQHEKGEWFVVRDAFVRARKQIAGEKARARFSFSGASLRELIVEQNDVRLLAIELEADAAVAQATFPEVEKQVKLPVRARTVAHCSALAGAHAGLLEIVEEAMWVEHCDLYPPKDPEANWVFVCADQGETTARGTLRPMISAAATKGTGDDDGAEDDSPRGRRKKNSRQQELAS